MLSPRGADGGTNENLCNILQGMIELLKQQQATWERLRWLEDGRARDLDRLSRLLDAFGGRRAA
jgi:hypothetical protein